jgi:hypothetical protein
LNLVSNKGLNMFNNLLIVGVLYLCCIGKACTTYKPMSSVSPPKIPNPSKDISFYKTTKDLLEAIKNNDVILNKDNAKVFAESQEAISIFDLKNFKELNINGKPLVDDNSLIELAKKARFVTAENIIFNKADDLPEEALKIIINNSKNIDGLTQHKFFLIIRELNYSDNILLELAKKINGPVELPSIFNTKIDKKLPPEILEVLIDKVPKANLSKKIKGDPELDHYVNLIDLFYSIYHEAEYKNARGKLTDKMYSA